MAMVLAIRGQETVQWFVHRLVGRALYECTGLEVNSRLGKWVSHGERCSDRFQPSHLRKNPCFS